MLREDIIKILENLPKKEYVIKRDYPLIYGIIIDYEFGVNFSQKLYNYIYGITQLPKCKYDDCANLVAFFNYSYGYKKYCSKECECKNISLIKINYSDEKKNSIQESRVSTCIKNYGVDNIAKMDSIKLKTEFTNIDRYGVKSPMQNIDILNKRATNNKKKWGVEYLTQIPELMLKYSAKRKYTINCQIVEKYKSLGINVVYFNDSKITCICEKCNKEYTTNLYIVYQRVVANMLPCIFCYPLGDSQESKFQKSVGDFLKSIGIDFLSSDRKLLNGKELDIYIPTFNVAIECNGTYWHNELYKHKNYHRDKYLECKKLGINLIQIWQDDWLYKSDIVKSRLCSKFNKTKTIGARKCNLRKIGFKECVDFLNKNHLQSSVPSKINYGLFYKEELISVMTFTKNRISVGNKNDYELLRFCNKVGHTVVGAANKLFKAFILDYKPLQVNSYSNLEWGEGNFYELLGFNRLLKDTIIGYSYVDKGIKRHRFNYRKDILVKQGFDVDKSEHQIMLDRKIYRVYHSGNAIWQWSNL